MLYAGSYHEVSVEAEVLSGLTWTGELLWYADAGREQAVAVDPYSGEHLAAIACPGLCAGLATSAGHLVYVEASDQRLHTVDPATGQLVQRARNPRPDQEIAGLEGGRQGLWIGYRDLLDLRSVPDYRLIDCISSGRRVTGVTVTDRYLVYCTHPAEAMRVPLGAVTVVDPTLRQEILSINVHGTPTGLTWDGSHVWYCDNATSRLRAIDIPGIVR